MSERTASDERPDWIWHDVEQILRDNHDVDDDTFKGSAKEIYNLFLANGWIPPRYAPRPGLNVWRAEHQTD